MPNKLTLATLRPAIVEAMCVPCPSLSLADLKKILLKSSRGPNSASKPVG